LSELKEYGVLLVLLGLTMKTIKNLAAVLVVGLLAAAPLVSRAADEKKPADDKKVKPYKLETCIVSDEKLGEMGKPFVMEYKGQEIKLCCKNCQKDFDKEPAKYMKKMAEEEKKAEAKKPKAAK
jgi:YHS domain-containing protein